MKLQPADVPLWLWFLLAAVLLAQSIWLFYDARRRGLYPWFWGIWGLFQFPFPTLIYLLFARKIFRKSK
jgi:hypothetical protein